MATPPNDYAKALRANGAWMEGVSVRAAHQGASLQAQDSVKAFKASRVAGNQVRLSAEIHCPGQKTPRSVLVFLSRRDDGKVLVAPNCSCREPQMCEHVVAAIQEFMSLCQREVKGKSDDGRVSARETPAGYRTSTKKRRQKREARYLACQLVAFDEAQGSGLALEVVHSPRAMVDGIGMVRCDGQELYSNELEENLGQRWMKTRLIRLRSLAGEELRVSRRPVQLQPDAESMGSLLQDLLKWQILYWGGGPNPILLHEGEARVGKPVWRLESKAGQFMPCWDIGDESDAVVVIPSAPLYYVDTRRRVVGLVETDFSPEVAALWGTPYAAPSEADVRAWNAKAERGRTKGRFPLPPSRTEIDGRNEIPRPFLFLHEKELPRSTMRGIWSPVYEQQAVGAISFGYGEHEVLERGDGVSQTDERVRVERNGEEEKARVEEINQLGLRLYSETLPEDVAAEDVQGLRWVGTWQTMAGQAAWMTFMTEAVPALIKSGWEVRYAEDFPMRFVQPDRWVQELREKRDRSWFEFELGVDCDGERIDLLPVLISYLENGADVERQLEFLGGDDRVPIKLEDGRYLAFPVKRLRPIVQILKDIMEGRRATRGDDGWNEVHQLVAADFLQESVDYTRVTEGQASLAAVGTRLRSFDGVEKACPPSGLQATLRGYQEEGFRWLQFLSQYGLGGILADDMGLGKTLQTIAHLLCEKESGRLRQPALVVVPTSLLGNWQAEVGKFAPSLRVHLHYGSARHGKRASFDAADIIFTTYALVYRDQEFLESCCFSHLILDEAQNIKNPSSRSAQAVGALQAERRLCLSGTPMENHLEELWSLFHFLMPGFLGYLDSFRRRFRYPIEREDDEAAKELLTSRVSPLMLRRKKTEVAKELPPKTEMVRMVELEGAQRDLYETIRASMQQRVHEVIAEQGIERAHLYILEALLRLRQVCCHPKLLDLEAAQSVEQSAKMELLFDLLPEMIAEGRRILLFSQFTSMLGLIERRLLAEGRPYVKLTGNTRNRSKMVDQFQEGKVPLFLISLKAGGVGLNLTKADTVIHYDPWWNPAVESQATDRAYRIGQEQPVFVYKLITQGSIEERIVAMQEDKRELVESLLGAGRRSGMRVGKEELEMLLRPLS